MKYFEHFNVKKPRRFLVLLLRVGNRALRNKLKHEMNIYRKQTNILSRPRLQTHKMSSPRLDPITLAAAHFEWRNVEMKIETNLSVAIENFCFSEIVPARLAKTISLTNVQHFGQSSSPSPTRYQVHNSLEAIYGHTTFLLLLKLLKVVFHQYSDDIDITSISFLSLVNLSIKLNFHSWMAVVE